MPRSIPLSRRAGLVLALLAAVISGFSVYINSVAVKHAPSALSFTTAKNLVAAVILATALCASPASGRATPALRALPPLHWLGLAFVGVVGGGVAFALFFEGLARADATQAAFVQKSLLLWVALLAVPLLHERVGWRHVVAIGLLLGGQLLLGGNIAQQRPVSALLLVFGATLLWSIEIVVVRTLLRYLSPTLIGAVRMSIGCVVLIVWLGATQTLAQLGALGHEWTWVVLTGVLLAGYVATWFGALRRAPAVDVTAILVLGAFITALLSLPATHAVIGVQVSGLALVLSGVALVLRARPARRVSAALS